MQKKANELEIKQSLLSKLSKITTCEDDKESIILGADETTVIVRKKYDKEKFRFLPGQFIQVIYGCSCDQRNEIALCVGVGKGCSKDKERDELWFLFEENGGISHFCGARVEEFNRWEKEGELILLEPEPDVMN